MNFSVLVVALGIVSADPKPEATDFWERHDAFSARTVDHRRWQAFLTKHLDTTARDGIHRFRYGAVSTQDLQGLERYLKSLQMVSVSTLNRNEQMSFWINLYNAATVVVVLRHYPVKSIRDIVLDAKPPGSGPWDAPWLRIEERDLSLNDIEHRILRPQWKDARVHFALNSASLGCPSLAVTVFSPANLEARLEMGARNFISSQGGVSFRRNTLRLSGIFEWHRADFGRSDREVLDFLARYARPGLADSLRKFSGRIEYKYDWNLNNSVSR